MNRTIMIELTGMEYIITQCPYFMRRLDKEMNKFLEDIDLRKQSSDDEIIQKLKDPKLLVDTFDKINLPPFFSNYTPIINKLEINDSTVDEICSSTLLNKSQPVCQKIKGLNPVPCCVCVMIMILSEKDMDKRREALNSLNMYLFEPVS